jgi:hypothetical protein
LLAITSQLAGYSFLDGGNISVILATIDRSVADDSFNVFAVPVHERFRSVIAIHRSPSPAITKHDR